MSKEGITLGVDFGTSGVGTAILVDKKLAEANVHMFKDGKRV